MQHDWFMYHLRSTYKNRLEFPFNHHHSYIMYSYFLHGGGGGYFFIRYTEERALQMGLVLNSDKAL